MFKITDEAASVLTRARDASGQPDDYGVRLFLERSDDGKPQLAFSFVAGPEPQDEVNRDERIPLYVASELAAVAPESTVDAETAGVGRTQIILRR